MKIEIGAMVNGMFIKKGSKVKMAKKNYNSFHAIVTDVDEERIDFIFEDDENGRFEYWDNIDFIELV